MDFFYGNQIQPSSWSASFSANAVIEQPAPAILPEQTPAPRPKVSTQEVAALFVTTRIAGNRSPYYVQAVKQYLKRFARDFPDMATITREQMENWLSQFTNAWSRKSWHGKISVLFNFAIKRDIGGLVKNPMLRIDKPTVDHGDPATLTVAQAQTLLRNCPSNVLPYLALALFAGCRPFEILRTKWSDVNLETRTVKIQGKTRRRRNVPLEPACVKILAKFQQLEGNVAPHHVTVRRWIRKVRPLVGGKWHSDLLRHTAASMLLAKIGDAGKVATILGNSPQILLTHYNNPVTATEAEKFWALEL